MNKKLISVIIITYNRNVLLEQCLNCLQKNNPLINFEIVVIDDGSTDDTQKVIKEHQKKYDNIRYFFQTHKGRGKARNLGLKKAKGDIVFFTDDDCLVEQDWLKKIIKNFNEHPDVSVVGGSIVNLNDNSNLDVACYLLNFSSWLPIGKKRCIEDIPTANIAYKKKSVEGLLFPIKYPRIDYEDTLFNKGLIIRKKKILFDPNIKVYHQTNLDYANFLSNQQMKAKSFFLRGYKTHGITGKMLINFRFLNLFCLRLFLIFLRCLKSKEYTKKYIYCFPYLLLGEFKRGLTLMENKR